MVVYRSTNIDFALDIASEKLGRTACLDKIEETDIITDEMIEMFRLDDFDA